MHHYIYPIIALLNLSNFRFVSHHLEECEVDVANGRSPDLQPIHSYIFFGGFRFRSLVRRGGTADEHDSIWNSLKASNEDTQQFSQAAQRFRLLFSYLIPTDEVLTDLTRGTPIATYFWKCLTHTLSTSLRGGSTLFQQTLDHIVVAVWRLLILHQGFVLPIGWDVLEALLKLPPSPLTTSVIALVKMNILQTSMIHNSYKIRLAQAMHDLLRDNSRDLLEVLTQCEIFAAYSWGGNGSSNQSPKWLDDAAPRAQVTEALTGLLNPDSATRVQGILAGLEKFHGTANVL
ncbi:hypothetical protein DFH08DRAFT_820498 [Mycena albidolilacea]|uniref:Uncharacterized protein n=1 Tax=Mycena albidolilacea TaxID=1033008 RepID=A0AAD7EFG8_9AGAR|nr:hypothetical protein DFH08DRAFT_820498 [Mycena albidolilacea]